MRRIVTFCCAVVALPLMTPRPLAQLSRDDLRTVRVTAGMDDGRLSMIRARLAERVDQGTLAGAVTLIARRGVVVVQEAVGFADIEARRPMDAGSIFRVASITKIVTAVGIMILQEEGRLALGDPVQRYLPEFREVVLKNGARPASPVTIHGLLTHTGGVATEQALFSREFMSRTLADVVAIYAQAPLEHEPGSTVNYSSPGFDILGRIIEVVSGQPYDVFIGERVLKPLGMQDTHFFLPRGKLPRLAAFYRREGGGLVATQMDMSHEGRVFPAPGWGLYSTAPDLVKLLQMMLNRGMHDGHRLLSRASVEIMTTDQIAHLTPQSQPMSAGLAWGVARRPGAVGPLASSAAYRTVASSGSVVWVDPDQELIGVVLTHQPVDLSLFMTVMAMASAAIVK